MSTPHFQVYRKSYCVDPQCDYCHRKFDTVYGLGGPYSVGDVLKACEECLRKDCPETYKIHVNRFNIPRTYPQE